MDKSIAQVASHLELYTVFTQGLRFGFFVGGGVVLFSKGNTYAVSLRATLYKSLLKSVSASTVTPPTSFP